MHTNLFLGGVLYMGGERAEDMQQSAVGWNQTWAPAKDSAFKHGVHAVPGELPL